MNAPKRIWVDTCKDADGEPEWDTGAWSLNQEQDDDREYVRSDLFEKAVEALRHTLDKPRSADQTYASLWSEVMWEIRFVVAELEGK